MLNEREMKVLAGFLRELMPVGANYHALRFREFMKFLCTQLEIDLDELVKLMLQ